MSLRFPAAALFLSFATAASAAPVVGWRNDGSGTFSSATPPLHWGPDKNVLWSTPLPSWSNGSPIVVGDRVFVTAEPTWLVAIGLDGKLLWKKRTDVIDTVPVAERPALEAKLKRADEVAADLEALKKEHAVLKRQSRKKGAAGDGTATKLAQMEARLDALKAELDTTQAMRTPELFDTIGYTSSTPVSDGRRVFALFANGVAAAFDLDGNRLWARVVGERQTTMNGNTDGHAASPLLVGGRLVLPFGKLQAVDPKDGRTLWTAVDYRDFGTPLAFRRGNEDLLAVPDGRVLRAADGSLVGSDAGVTWYIGPVTDGRDLIYAGYAGSANGEGSPLFRLQATPIDKLAGRAEPRVALTAGRERVMASPLVHEGLVYVVEHDSPRLVVYDLKDGSVVYTERLDLDGPLPSIGFAGGRLHAHDKHGDTLVFAPGRTFRQLARNPLEPFRATPFFAGSRIYVRTFTSLVCIGQR